MGKVVRLHQQGNDHPVEPDDIEGWTPAQLRWLRQMEIRMARLERQAQLVDRVHEMCPAASRIMDKLDRGD